MSDYITVPCSSSVDMLRFKLRYSGEPGAALEWFEKLCADVLLKYGRPDPKDPHQKLAVRYPLSLRVGTYREMLQIPAGESSVVVAMGRNGKGEKNEYREGFLEFNPVKVYPSPQLEFLYELLDKEPNAMLELVRWDFATDYPIGREKVVLMKDGRKYACVISDSHTSYLGRRNNRGFVKVYDKRAELLKSGKLRADPLTRVEVTIEEPTLELGKMWPRLVMLPETLPDKVKGNTRLLILAAMHGVDVEEALQGFGNRQRTEYRNRMRQVLGEIAPPQEYAECRRDAQAWARWYGGANRESMKSLKRESVKA